jgi:hypothetical protein
MRTVIWALTLGESVSMGGDSGADVVTMRVQYAAGSRFAGGVTSNLTIWRCPPLRMKRFG